MKKPLIHYFQKTDKSREILVTVRANPFLA